MYSTDKYFYDQVNSYITKSRGFSNAGRPSVSASILKKSSSDSSDHFTMLNLPVSLLRIQILDSIVICVLDTTKCFGVYVNSLFEYQLEGIISITGQCIQYFILLIRFYHCRSSIPIFGCQFNPLASMSHIWMNVSASKIFKTSRLMNLATIE